MKITLENILNAAKTEEQKKMALAKIQKEIKKNRLIARIYGLVYFVNLFFLVTAFFTLLFVQGELVFFEKLPDIIIKILDTYNRWIMSISEWAVLKKFDEWIMSVEILPTWVIYLAVVAIVIVAVPSIIISIVKVITAVFTSRDAERAFYRRNLFRIGSAGGFERVGSYHYRRGAFCTERLF